MQSNGDYLQTESQAKELIACIPAHSPCVTSYGGEEIPRSVVLVQMYQTKKKETQPSGVFHQVFKPVINKDTGKQDFEMVEIEPDKDGKKNFKKVLKWQQNYSFKESRTVKGENIENCLSVIPLRAKVDKEELRHLLGCNLNELQTAITEGKPIKRTRVMKDREIETITNVKATIRKGAICHLFVKFNGLVFSTVQVNGGVKGADLLNDFPQSCAAFYHQIKSAMNSNKPVQVSEAIAKALNLKVSK